MKWRWRWNRKIFELNVPEAPEKKPAIEYFTKRLDRIENWCTGIEDRRAATEWLARVLLGLHRENKRLKKLLESK